MFADSKALTPRAVLEYPLGHPPERMALDAVTAPDDRVIHFERMEHGAIISVERPGAKAVPLEQAFVLHSPTGLEFGYGGSGPADTALNVLSLVLSPRESWRFHQNFKAEVIAQIRRDGGTLTLADVRGWIAEAYRAELADTARMTDEKEMRELLAEIAAEERSLAETEG